MGHVWDYVHDNFIPISHIAWIFNFALLDAAFSKVELLNNYRYMQYIINAKLSG